MTAIRRLDSQSASKAEQKEALRAALIENGGNITRTAESIRLSRSHINDLLNEYELRPLVTELRTRAGWNGLGRPPGKSVR